MHNDILVCGIMFKTTKMMQLSETMCLYFFFVSTVHPQAQSFQTESGGGDAGDERIALSPQEQDFYNFLLKKRFYTELYFSNYS